LKTEQKRNRYRLIWELMAGRRLQYGAAIGALIVASCFLYLVPLVPQVVIDGVLGDGESSSFVNRWVARGGGAEFIRSHLWYPAVLVLLLTAVAGIFTYLRGRWSAMASEEIACRVRDRLYDHLQHLPCSYHDTAETGDLVQRCTSDVETLRRFLATQVVEIGRAIFMMLIPIPLMLALDRRMTMVSVVTIPVIVIFSLVFFHKVRASFKLADEAEGKMTTTVQENLTGIRVVRAFARQEFEQDRFDEKNGIHRRLNYRLYKLMAAYWSLSDLLCMGQKALVVFAGGYWLAAGEVQVGTFYFFLAAVNMFIWPVRMMGRILTDFGKALVAIDRIAIILEHPREREAELSDDDTSRLSAGASWRQMGSHVVFDGVTFSHDGETDVLTDVSFELRPGKTLALLGPSGSGKSTIVNLLLRFYDYDHGEIRVDGEEIRGVARREVRSKIAVVMQEPFLYSKSLKDNIHLGRKAAVEDEVFEAASTACVHDTILEFEEGYNTVVGERGVTLSGGQRQRVALARALLDKPPILILDDALSAVDTDTEAMILGALRRQSRQCSRIVIAHRLSTLMTADEILVLEAGRIIQRGNHESLINDEGLYKRLWEKQNAMIQDLTRECADGQQ
jgi:ATP-binding cassette, subfamily B, bacterial